jgi:hypothetical protein
MFPGLLIKIRAFSSLFDPCSLLTCQPQRNLLKQDTCRYINNAPGFSLEMNRDEWIENQS